MEDIMIFARKLASMLLVAAAAVAWTAAPAAAQGYPNRTVQIVNPTQAGATTDVLARALAVGLASRLGHQFVIVNRAGAGGAIGTAAVARAEPDGYTLWFGAIYTLSVLTRMKETEAGYEANALVPVCQTVSNAMMIVVKADSPHKTLADLVKDAKANPGKLNYGHQGAGSIPNLAIEEFLEAAGLKINSIPFRGDPAVITGLLGGNVEVGGLVQGTAATARDRLRILGIFAEERHPSFPDVPTVKEQGFNVAPISFGGLMAPAATPQPVIERLASACEGAAKDEAYVKPAKAGGQPDNYYADRKVFGERLERDIANKARVLKTMGLSR
jgi:tripartite-type tricarboxylate transporter receptor subunit TctC